MFTLDFPTEKVMVRDLIRACVCGEVQEYSAHRGEIFRGFIRPTDAKRALNGFKATL